MNYTRLCLIVVLLCARGAYAQNKPDEPKAESYSLPAAVAFMDKASQDWTGSRKCFACHTNYVYLMAKPLTESGQVDEAHRAVRAELEKMVEERWEKSGPRWDAEVVMSAAVLAMNDAATTGKLHVTTRKALDRMWKVQRADGGFDWLKCGWPPMESDDDYGSPSPHWPLVQRQKIIKTLLLLNLAWPSCAPILKRHRHPRCIIKPCCCGRRLMVSSCYRPSSVRARLTS